MIGYSDSGKDVGRFSAVWRLYIAQEELIKVAKHYGVNLTMFHGRGGTVGIGGGPSHLVILFQLPETIHGSPHVTDMGHSEALLLRGRAYYYLADYDVARQHNQKSLLHDPDLTSCNNALDTDGELPEALVQRGAAQFLPEESEENFCFEIHDFLKEHDKILMNVSTEFLYESGTNATDDSESVFEEYICIGMVSLVSSQRMLKRETVLPRTKLILGPLELWSDNFEGKGDVRQYNPRLL